MQNYYEYSMITTMQEVTAIMIWMKWMFMAVVVWVTAGMIMWVVVVG